MKKISLNFLLLLTFLLSGCVQLPVTEGELSKADVEACVVLAEKESGLQRLGERGLFGALKGAVMGVGVDAVLAETTLAVPRVGNAVLNVSSLLPAFLVFGIVEGVGQGLFDRADRRSAIVRDCLKDRGYKVY